MNRVAARALENALLADRLAEHTGAAYDRDRADPRRTLIKRSPAYEATSPGAYRPVLAGRRRHHPYRGGGQVGLLLISPYVKPGSTDVVDYFNHFSLLASIESLFGLHRLGYGGAPGLPVFGIGVSNNYAG